MIAPSILLAQSSPSPSSRTRFRFDITGIGHGLKPMQDALLVCHLPDHSRLEIPLKVRLDTPAEVDYYLAGGILPYVLDQILA